MPIPGAFEVDELIRAVALRAGISPVRAALAVTAVLSYLAARLPSPVVGSIRAQLGCARGQRDRDGREEGVV